ncbi:MAG: acyltransferase [Gemmatimonadaceae bacterium]|nr:acyltransferase [Gemmatimonadaceae bacterium]
MQGLVKQLGQLMALAIVMPVYLHLRLWYALRPAAREQSFQGHSQLMSLVPGLVGNFLRRAFYQRTLTRYSSDCCISFGTTFATADAIIGRGVYVGSHCNLGHVELQDDVLLGSGVMITSGKRQHFFKRLDIPIRLQGGELTRVTIGYDSWLGNGSIVMADVAPHAVVGAGAVVVSPVPERAIVAGNPAVVVSVREHRD